MNRITPKYVYMSASEVFHTPEWSVDKFDIFMLLGKNKINKRAHITKVPFTSCSASLQISCFSLFSMETTTHNTKNDKHVIIVLKT